MMAPWRELLRKLRAATARERAGLALVAAVAALAAALAAFDWAFGAGQAAHNGEAQRGEAAATFTRDSSRAFQERLGAETNKVWRWSIAEASEGVAVAQAMAALEGLAAQAGLGDVLVSTNDAALGAEGAVSSLSLTLNADFDWAGFLRLLQAMEASDLSLTPEAVEVSTNQGEAARLTMSVRAPFLREAPQP